MRAVDARGKHLFVRFGGEMTLHSHLGMAGAWSVHRAGQPCPRCGTAIRARGQAEGNRVTYWRPGCEG